MFREYCQINQIKLEKKIFQENEYNQIISSTDVLKQRWLFFCRLRRWLNLRRSSCCLTVTDLAVDASRDQATVVFVDLDFVVLVDVLVNVTDLAVAASSDVAAVVFVDLVTIVLVDIDVDVLPDVDVVVFFDVAAVVIVEVDVDVFVGLTAVVSVDVVLAALEGFYAFSSISLCFLTEVSVSYSSYYYLLESRAHLF